MEYFSDSGREVRALRESYPTHIPVDREVEGGRNTLGVMPVVAHLPLPGGSCRKIEHLCVALADTVGIKSSRR